MCHHLFNSLTAIKYIYRRNNHSTFNTNFIDLQPEEGKMNIWDVFSLCRKKRHLTWLWFTSDLSMQMNSHEQSHPSSAHLEQPTLAWLAGAWFHFRVAWWACKLSCAGHTDLPPCSPHTRVSFPISKSFHLTHLFHNTINHSFSIWPQYGQRQPQVTCREDPCTGTRARGPSGQRVNSPTLAAWRSRYQIHPHRQPCAVHDCKGWIAEETWAWAVPQCRITPQLAFLSSDQALKYDLFATQMCLGEDQRNTNSKGHDKLINTGSVKVGCLPTDDGWGTSGLALK